jgi:hypothetical protein
MKTILTVLTISIGLLAGGCSSTQKRASIGGVGVVAGAAAGYGVAKATGGDTGVGAGVGALVGGVTTALLLGEDNEVYLRGVNEGYVMGSSDAVKRMYWLKQAMEKPGAQLNNGVVSYYIYEESGMTKDGRKLAPEKVAVPVYEPRRE